MRGPEELTDAQHRAAVDRIGQNLALRSGAGCGKTLVLARRFAELLMAEPAEDPLSRFVALTFTDKAALEMAQRVRRFLGEIAAKAKGDSRRRLLEWLEGLGQARISTIHSFCASLLRSSAIEAGVDLDFAVCGDKLLTDQMVASATEQAVLEAVEQRHGGATRLLSASSLEHVTGLVAGLIERRTSADLGQYRDPAAILARWEKLTENQRRSAWSALKADAGIAALVAGLEKDSSSVDPADKLAEFIRQKLELARRITADPASATIEMFDVAGKSAGGRGSATAWGGDQEVKGVRQRVKQLGGLIREYTIYTERLGPLDRGAAEGLAALAELAMRADALYAAAKRGRGMLDFTDLLETTDKLLREEPSLARSLGEGIGQLLVDECQDTDAFQVRLLERLVRLGEERAPLPEGRLFIVGDAKQSIYRFRGAQVEVFQDWCRRLGAGRCEDLELSFRTHPAAAAFVNHVFEPLMGEDYSPITAHRRNCPPQPSVEIILAEGVGGEQISTAGQAVAAQAAATAERIGQMIAGDEKRVWDEAGGCWRAVRAGDIAILFARMTASLEYERQLAQRSIAYYVVAGSGFFRQQEVFDVLNALRAIDNPFDDVALLGVLRSSLFGLDDNALLRIALGGRAPYWPALAEGRLPEGLNDSARRALTAACEMIAHLHRDKDALGIDRLIEGVLSVSGYEGTLLAQRHGRRMLGNVRMLLDQARAAAAEGLALADFIARMDELVLNESRYEQAAVAGEAENVVRLMTIHKAKGLEFPVVFVVDLNSGRRGDSRDSGKSLLCRSDWGLTFKLKAEQEDALGEAQDQEQDAGNATGADTPLSYRLARLLEDRDQAREEVRKLYVAVTRAKDHVVLVGANWWADKGNGTFKEGGSFLRSLDEVLGIGRAVDEGLAAIPYGQGQYKAEVKLVRPSDVEAGRRARSRGEKMLAAATSGADLAERMLAAAPTGIAAPPLVGPLPVETARAGLAVTALNDFARCPMLYRWRHELRVPVDLLRPLDASGQESARRSPSPTDPAAAGTLLHTCMEMLDFRNPQPASSLIAAAACRLEPDAAIDTEALAGAFQEMLEKFLRHRLLGELRSARTLHRELAFAAPAGPATLRGQIDLLYEDGSGRWRIVDYKSDHVDPDRLAERAADYELQLLAYATAAGRYLGQPVKEAAIYFLRLGCTHSMTLTAGRLAAGEERLAEVARRLIAARRSGQFDHQEGRLCPSCPYRPLCLPALAR